MNPSDFSGTDLEATLIYGMLIQPALHTRMTLANPPYPFHCLPRSRYVPAPPSDFPQKDSTNFATFDVNVKNAMPLIDLRITLC